MTTLGQLVLFGVGLYCGWVLLKVAYLVFKYWIAVGIITTQFEQAVETDVKLTSDNRINYDEETLKVVEQILIQMVQGLKYQQPWMLKHAMRHMAVLYTTTIWLTKPPTDARVQDAIDVIKQKFYYMHGTFLNIRRSKVRNNINLFLQTSSGGEPPKAEEYDPTQHGMGCRIKIVVSVVTPLTSKSYRYLNHIQ